MEIKLRLSGVSEHTCCLDKPQHFVALKRVIDLQPLLLAEAALSRRRGVSLSKTAPASDLGGRK